LSHREYKIKKSMENQLSYDKERAECECPWNLDISAGSRGLFYSYCNYCYKLTDIRGYKFRDKLKWTLRLWGITKRPMKYSNQTDL